MPGERPLPGRPNDKVTSGRLYGTAAASASDAWAVGLIGGGPGDGTGPTDKTLIEHWDGESWNVVPSPTPAPASGLTRVTVISPSDAWAVGQSSDSSGSCAPQCRTIIEHWDGCMWTVVPSPNPPSGYLNDLWDVAVVADRTAWAVGTTGYAATLIAHWNGTSCS